MVSWQGKRHDWMVKYGEKLSWSLKHINSGWLHENKFLDSDWLSNVISKYHSEKKKKIEICINFLITFLDGTEHYFINFFYT